MCKCRYTPCGHVRRNGHTIAFVISHCCICFVFSIFVFLPLFRSLSSCFYFYSSLSLSRMMDATLPPPTPNASRAVPPPERPCLLTSAAAPEPRLDLHRPLPQPSRSWAAITHARLFTHAAAAAFYLLRGRDQLIELTGDYGQGYQM